MSPTRIRNLRLSPPLNQLVTAHEARRGETFSELTRDALFTALNIDDLEAALVDSLADFETMTLSVRADLDGEPTVEVAEVKRRTHIPGFPDRPYKPTDAPLTDFVDVKARPERRGRTVIELVGLPPDFADVHIFALAVPTGADATITMRLDDLNPALRVE